MDRYYRVGLLTVRSSMYIMRRSAGGCFLRPSSEIFTFDGTTRPVTIGGITRDNDDASALPSVRVGRRDTAHKMSMTSGLRGYI